MMVWKDFLKPIKTTCHPECTIHEALKAMSDSKQSILFLTDDKGILGYFDHASLLHQLQVGAHLDDPIQYRKDVLSVPQYGSIEFYHNISVIIGMDDADNPTGFCTFSEARTQIDKLKLEQMNQVLSGAGMGIVMTNPQHSITFMNEVGESIYGLSSSFLLGRNYKTLLTTDIDLDEVVHGKQFMSVKGSLNFKEVLGNFSPFVIDGQVSGTVHLFFLREQLEENVSKMEFVQDLNSDLEAIYSCSNEQILIANAEGKIIRFAGKFLSNYWMLEQPDPLLGRTASSLEEEGLFRPNVIAECLAKRVKLGRVQENTFGRKLWSVATPIFRDKELEKVIVISRDMTEMNQLHDAMDAIADLEDMDKSPQREKNTLVYRSRIMENLLEQVRRVSRVDSTILLVGESGVGKEVVASAVHDYSPRKERPFVRVNCGAVAENLIESELFGYEKGAFTGADSRGKPGLFEAAHGGTIFLDEITEVPLSAQVKLLRVLQERELTRVGGTKPIRVDVRVIAATNQNIRELVATKKFREDLYYRLHVIPIPIPPLRNRMQDVEALALHFMGKFNAQYQSEKTLSMEARTVLENYNWPGNVRELQNIIERLLVTTRENVISQDDVLYVLYGESNESPTKPIVFDLMPLKDAVSEVESQLIRLGMQKLGTAAKVSEVLGVSPATISRKMQKLSRQGVES